MSDTSKLSTCQIVCWGLSGLTGLIVLWSATGAVGFLAALLLAIAFAALLGLVSTRLVCTGYRAEDRGIEARDVEQTLRNATGVTGYKAPDPEEEEGAAAAPAPKPNQTPAADPAPAADPVASAATAAPPAAAEDASTGHASSAEAVRAGTTLSGEEELAARKGEWRYEGAAQDEGTRPEALDGPRDGTPDDLKKIKGVGPKLEKLINEMGFYHFDQIANWTGAEVAWVDENLKGFKGRVSRDNWVEQAKILASGGETEFSNRVGEGNVY